MHFQNKGDTEPIFGSRAVLAEPPEWSEGKNRAFQRKPRPSHFCNSLCSKNALIPVILSLAHASVG